MVIIQMVIQMVIHMIIHMVIQIGRVNKQRESAAKFGHTSCTYLADRRKADERHTSIARFHHIETFAFLALFTCWFEQL